MATQDWVMATAILISLYACLILYFVIRGALKTKNLQDYAVGSQTFPPVIVGLSLAASITSAATFIINPGFIALYGISGVISFAIMLPLGLFISLSVLTRKFRKQGTKLSAITLAQWIGKRYGNAGFSFFFAVLSLLLITFMVLICVGMTKVLSQALNADEAYVLTGLIVFVYGYMMFGGANSLAYTNAIQAILMLIVAVILLGSGYDHFSEGVHGFMDKLTAIDPALTGITNPDSYLFRDFFEIFICAFIVGIAIVCQPHILTRSLLLKEDKDVTTYLTSAIIVEAIFFAVVIIGLYARIQFPDLMVDGKAIPMDGIVSAYVVAEFPVWVGLIVILGLLSAGLSTLEGLIQSLSTTISSDLMQPIKAIITKQDIASSAMPFWVNKIVIIGLAIVTGLLSWQQLVSPSLSVGIFAQNGVYAYFSTAFMPILMGIFLPDTKLRAPLVAAIVAVIVYFSVSYGGITWYMQAAVRNPAIPATFAIIASVLTGFIFYKLQKKSVQHVS
jgi:sodium/pantothenate symporter